MRDWVPDLVGINFSFSYVTGFGPGLVGQLSLITRGKDAGFHFTYTPSARVGEESSASVNFVTGSYNGPVNAIAFSQLLGQSADINVNFGYFDAGLWASYNDSYITWYGSSFGFGFGAGASVGFGVTR